MESRQDLSSKYPKDLIALFDALRSATTAMADASDVVQHHLHVAEIQIELRFSDVTTACVLMPALRHLQLVGVPHTTPAIRFDVCSGRCADIQPPPLPFAPEDYHRYGQRAACDDGVRSFMHSPTAGMIFAYDRESQYGLLWIKDPAALSIYERAAPLQTLFHWALQTHDIQIVHAAAVGQTDGGVLLVGNSGAGKSTTALSSIYSDSLRYLGDDKCLVRLSPDPQAFSLFSSAKLKADMLQQYPLFSSCIEGWDDEYKAGKGLAFLYPTYRDQLVTSFPLRAIVIPRIAHLAKPHLSSAKASDAFRVLGPSTVIWLPGTDAESYHFLSQLVRQLPCFFLDLATTPQDNLPALVDLIASVS